MPPTTRSRSRMQEPDDSPAASEPDSEELGCNASGICTFPSRLTYSLDELDEGTQAEVASIMFHDPPKCILQECVAREEGFIVFQVAELVQHSVRAIQPGTKCDFPPCNCEEHARTQRPCRHMLWLFDQITNQLVPTQRTPLTLTKGGYPSELGSLYDRINEFHADMMAEALHSQEPVDTEDDNRTNPHRVQAIRDMMASLDASPVDEYRPDLFANPTKGKRVIKARDLEGTIFRMLLRNDSFFQYFRSSLKYDELLRSPLKKLQWRMETAIAKFDAFRLAPDRPSHGRFKDAQWCAAHLSDVDRQIKSIVLNKDHPYTNAEYYGIITLLIHMIQEVINRNDNVPREVRARRNLYSVLLGDKDRDFITGTLNDIPSEHLFPFTAEINGIIDTLGQLGYGAPATYIGKLRKIITHARHSSARSPSGSKRPSGGQDSRAKRMK
ncbi:hypothetical protein PG985_005945 [Apiospora marii]|uniref:SWIM-type domain-containing protein n=1 Tax=Apiospora marii TaxID=335849 RepID=A0ABR1S6M1_9PEZI